jgi:hypothetical protein
MLKGFNSPASRGIAGAMKVVHGRDSVENNLQSKLTERNHMMDDLLSLWRWSRNPTSLEKLLMEKFWMIREKEQYWEQG